MAKKSHFNFDCFRSGLMVTLFNFGYLLPQEICKKIAEFTFSCRSSALLFYAVKFSIFHALDVKVLRSLKPISTVQQNFVF